MPYPIQIARIKAYTQPEHMMKRLCQLGSDGNHSVRDCIGRHSRRSYTTMLGYPKVLCVNASLRYIYSARQATLKKAKEVRGKKHEGGFSQPTYHLLQECAKASRQPGHIY